MITTSIVVACKRKTAVRRKGPLRAAAKIPIHSSAYPKLNNMSERIRSRVPANIQPIDGSESIIEAKLKAFRTRLYTTKGTSKLSK